MNNHKFGIGIAKFTDSLANSTDSFRKDNNCLKKSMDLINNFIDLLQKSFIREHFLAVGLILLRYCFNTVLLDNRYCLLCWFCEPDRLCTSPPPTQNHKISCGRNEHFSLHRFHEKVLRNVVVKLWWVLGLKKFEPALGRVRSVLNCKVSIY